MILITVQLVYPGYNKRRSNYDKKELLQLMSRTKATALWAKFTTETGGETILFPSEQGQKLNDVNLFLSMLDYEKVWG